MKRNLNNDDSTKSDVSLKKIASIHEAGHAVIYHLYGHTISSIEIADNGSGIVNCCVHVPNSGIYNDDDSIYRRLDLYGILCLSGYCAELKFQKIPIRGRIRIVEDEVIFENDISTLERLITEIFNKPKNDFRSDFYFHLLQNQTKELIRKPKIWKAILCLSEELIMQENNTMDGEKAHRILNQYVKFGIKKSEYFLSYP